MFIQMLTYKQEEKGHILIKVRRDFASTQMCSACRYVNEALSGNDRIRRWTCPCCHTPHDRDQNAAVNIKNEGLRMLCSACPPPFGRAGTART